MGTFKYCSSKDELSWYVNPNLELHVYFRAEDLEIKKLCFRQWIEECCQGTVYVWNGVCLPRNGDAISLGMKKIMPHGDATFYFEKPEDYTLFVLKYGRDKNVGL